VVETCFMTTHSVDITTRVVLPFDFPLWIPLSGLKLSQEARAPVTLPHLPLPVINHTTISTLSGDPAAFEGTAFGILGFFLKLATCPALPQFGAAARRRFSWLPQQEMRIVRTMPLPVPCSHYQPFDDTTAKGRPGMVVAATSPFSPEFEREYTALVEGDADAIFVRCGGNALIDFILLWWGPDNKLHASFIDAKQVKDADTVPPHEIDKVVGNASTLFDGMKRVINADVRIAEKRQNVKPSLADRFETCVISHVGGDKKAQRVHFIDPTTFEFSPWSDILFCLRKYAVSTT